MLTLRCRLRDPYTFGGARRKLPTSCFAAPTDCGLRLRPRCPHSLRAAKVDTVRIKTTTRRRNLDAGISCVHEPDQPQATSRQPEPQPRHVAIVGGGPSGLLCAQRLAERGFKVDVYDHMPAVGLKFLIAGRGGLNLTHADPLPAFQRRYGAHEALFADLLRRFGPGEVRAWAADLGFDTFVGSSRRVFPVAPDMKRAAPLLRAWLRRLEALHVAIHPDHTFLGFCPPPEGAGRWAPPMLRLRDSAGSEMEVRSDAVVLALGGASWPRLGSTGAWVHTLTADCHLAVEPLQPANVGLQVVWSPQVWERFAGTAVKSVELGFRGHRAKGDLMLTKYGIEGSAVNLLCSPVREALRRAAAGPPPERGQRGEHSRDRCSEGTGSRGAGGSLDECETASRGSGVEIAVDFAPAVSREQLLSRFAKQEGKKASVSNKLRKVAKLSPAAVAVISHVRAREGLPLKTPSQLTSAVKSLPLAVHALQDDAWKRAVSSAGGLKWSELDPQSLQVKKLPGVFVAGEMLDWDAPTGGFLLTGALSTGAAAAEGVIQWVERDPSGMSSD